MSHMRWRSPVAWQRTLHSAGWAGRSWPDEYGGHGAADWQTHAIAEEQTRYGVSTKMLAIALEMVPPVLLEHGTDEQCRAHLPVIVRGDEAWCQLLSEPDAGSDLGNVQTLASPADGGWTVSGQKVWTSGAVSADYALLLARTDRSDPGRGGVSFFALDMRQAGVTVRPLRQMSGGYHFNEVFLDDAFVPESALIGALGGGFAVLRTMLASERAAIGGGTSARSAAQLRTMAEETGRAGEPIVRQEVVRAHTREWLLDLVMARAASVPAGGPITKLLYSEHARLSANAALEILGASSMVTDDSRVRTVARSVPLRSRAPTRRWHRRDPAEHDRRARTRSAARTPLDLVEQRVEERPVGGGERPEIVVSGRAPHRAVDPPRVLAQLLLVDLHARELRQLVVDADE